MSKLSEKELAMLEDQLGYEQVLVKKYKAYAQATDDPQVKSKCEPVSYTHLAPGHLTGRFLLSRPKRSACLVQAQMKDKAASRKEGKHGKIPLYI